MKTLPNGRLNATWILVSVSRQIPSGPGNAQAYIVNILIQNSILPDSPGSPCYLATLQETGNKHTEGMGPGRVESWRGSSPGPTLSVSGVSPFVPV